MFPFFSESSHTAYQISENGAQNTHPQTLDGVKRSKHFFQKVMLQIKLQGKKFKTLFTLCSSPTVWAGIEIVPISMFL